MATGEFWTMNTWQMRAGQRGSALEEMTRNGIIPQYGKVPGVKAVKLMRILEGEGAGSDIEQYIAITIYESREAYNKWWTSESRELVDMSQRLQGTMDNWLKTASQVRVQRGVLTVDEEYGKDEPPPPPPTNRPNKPIGPIF
jgi:heme-degrading monooxygenase HmoA